MVETSKETPAGTGGQQEDSDVLARAQALQASGKGGRKGQKPPVVPPPDTSGTQTAAVQFAPEHVVFPARRVEFIDAVTIGPHILESYNPKTPNVVAHFVDGLVALEMSGACALVPMTNVKSIIPAGEDLPPEFKRLISAYYGREQ